MSYPVLIVSLLLIFLGLPGFQGFIIYQLKKRKPEEYDQVTKGRVNFYTISFLRFLLHIRGADDLFLKRVKIINLILIFSATLYVIYILNM